MLRIIQITTTTTAVNLWTAIVATGVCDSLGNIISGGQKTGEIFQDRCQNLDISSDTGNTTNTVTIGDKEGNEFNAFLPNVNFNKTSNRNTICLKDYTLKGTGSAIADVAMEFV